MTGVPTDPLNAARLATARTNGGPWRPGRLAVVAVVLLAVAGFPAGMLTSLAFAWVVLVVVFLVAWVVMACVRRRVGYRHAGPGSWRWWAAPVVLLASVTLMAGGIYGSIRLDLSRGDLLRYATTVAPDATTLDRVSPDSHAGMLEIGDRPTWVGFVETPVISRDGDVVDFVLACPACLDSTTGILYDPTGRYFEDQPRYTDSDTRGGYVLVADLGEDLYRYTAPWR